MVWVIFIVDYNQDVPTINQLPINIQRKFTGQHNKLLIESFSVLYVLYLCSYLQPFLTYFCFCNRFLTLAYYYDLVGLIVKSYQHLKIRQVFNVNCKIILQKKSMNKNGPNRVLTPQVLQLDQFGKKINFSGTSICFVFDIQLNPLIVLVNYSYTSANQLPYHLQYIL